MNITVNVYTRRVSRILPNLFVQAEYLNIDRALNAAQRQGSW